MLSRRSVLRAGGGLLAGLLPAVAAAQEIVEVRMRGTADGSKVWFDPIGLLVRPGQTIRWTNIDPGNSHTSTAYHPQNDNHALRIPDTAASWNSDYLLPDESFAAVLTVEGVYDYYCIPHEHAGMVGRIIVGWRGGLGMRPLPDVQADQQKWRPVPELARSAFPSVEEILRTGVVRIR
jgi:plastocyanin